MWRFGFVAVMSLAGGCTGDGGLTNDPSAGELGRAEFSWEETGFLCLFGCDAKAPVAAGATATLRVENHATLPPFTVRSDDPTIAQVTGTSLIDLEALRDGEVRILLEEDPGGAPLDEFLVRVSDVDHITSASSSMPWT